jgi:putative sterol carrier protein
MAVAADRISYEDLYARWEKGNWRAMEYDFAQDRVDWHERFSDLQRRAALWNYAMFFHGEDSVADNLSPFIDAAPREEQKYFLATQQVDEARHAVFFKRFMHEVVGAGDGSVSGGLEATRGELTYGFVKTFEHLDRVTEELRHDRSRTKLAQAVTMYHVIVEATLAQPGQHFIEAYLTRDELLPAFRAGMHNVSQDEQRHIGFGVKLLRDLALEDPEVPDAVADLLREVLPFTIGVFAPPGWDRSYSECFGFTLEEIYEEGAKSFESKLRAAGLPLEDLPGPVPYPIDLPPRERALRGMALLQSGILGQKNGPPARDPETMALLFDTVRRGVDFRTAPDGPLTVQWDFTDADAWHLRLDNGSTAVAPGRVEAPDIVFRARYEDFVDVVGGRLDPRRAMATGRLRPRGSLRTLWSARGIFGAVAGARPAREGWFVA